MPFAKYKLLTLASSAISMTTDPTNWPLCIGRGYGPQSADPDLKDTSNGGVIRPDGFDLAFYADLAQTTRYDAERVRYDGTTGSLEAHVRIPTLSHTADTTLYLFYGDPSVSVDPNTTNTWNSNFKGVWHLKDAGGTLVSPSPDSTSNAHNGTVSGATFVTGAIDGAASFAGSGTTPVIDFGASVVDLTSNWTISGWFQRPAAGSSSDRLPLYSRWTDTSTNRQIFVYFNGLGDNKINIDIPFIVAILSSTTTIAYNSGTWNHYTATRSGSTWRLYINGAEDASSPHTDATAQETGGHALIGNFASNSGQFVRGYLDETRISDVAVDASWVKADYQSQKASSTFITWGPATSVGGHFLGTLGVGR